MKWLPIDTVRKNGAQILVCGGKWEGDVMGIETENYGVALVHTDDGIHFGVCHTDCYEAQIRNPTHWMPIPECIENSSCKNTQSES